MNFKRRGHYCPGPKIKSILELTISQAKGFAHFPSLNQNYHSKLWTTCISYSCPSKREKSGSSITIENTSSYGNGFETRKWTSCTCPGVTFTSYLNVILSFNTFVKRLYFLLSLTSSIYFKDYSFCQSLAWGSLINECAIDY